MKTKDGWKHVGTWNVGNVGSGEEQEAKRAQSSWLEGCDPRRDEKSAEVIDKQRVCETAVTEKSEQTSEKKRLE